MNAFARLCSQILTALDVVASFVMRSNTDL